MSPSTVKLAQCRTVREVSRVLAGERITTEYIGSLFTGVRDSLADYCRVTTETIEELRSEVERLTLENQDMRFLLQAEQSQRSTPPEDAALYLAALLRVREMGYQSQAPRATDTVLACLRVCEQAIMEGENYRKRLQETERSAKEENSGDYQP